MSLKDYTEIKPKFTVDRFTDQSAPTAHSESFSKMTNYIPERGGASSRKGITSLAHIPDTSGITWTPESGGWESAVCSAVFKFENSSQLGYNSVTSAQENPLFGHMLTPNYSGHSTNSSNAYKEGGKSLVVTLQSSVTTAVGNPTRAFGLMQYTAGSSGPLDVPRPPSWFPGESTDAQAFMVTAWVYPLVNYGYGQYVFLCGGESAVSIGCWYSTAGIRIEWRMETGGLRAMQIPSSYLQTNQWNYIAFWMDWKKKVQGAYYYNDVTQGEWSSYYPHSLTANYFRLHTTRNCIGSDATYDAGGGGYRALDSAMEGYMDYMTMWTTIFTTNSSNVTLARKIRDLHKA